MGELLSLWVAGAMAAALSCCATGWAGEGAGAPAAGPPSIAAVTVSEPPVIDGVLDDGCWQQTTHVEGFWREKVDAAEPERTEAWLCYDRRAIYVAFRCHDSKPAEIRRNQKKRQGGMGDDDQVQFWLDVRDDGQYFYSFRVNPAGTQYDRTPGGTSEKIEWKGDWRAAASVDEGGWSAEMEIPFSILRYPDGQQTFRFDLARYLAREDDRSLWPSCLAKVFDTDNCARWTGVAAPPVPFRYVFMPYALTVASEDEQGREPLTGGLDFKGTLPNGVATLATYHPDFSNIEDVVETIDFTYTERWLPEYRPFFQEGSGYFPWWTLFYTRRIADLDWGAKAFGKVGAEQFGIVDAYGRGGENHLAGNYLHSFGTTASLGFSGVDRRVPDEPHNQAYCLNGAWSWPRQGRTRFAWADWYHSRTEGEGGDDMMLEYQIGEERPQGLDWSLGAQYIGPEFEADDGYVPETGLRSTGLHFDHHKSYDDSSVLKRDYHLHFNYGHSEMGGRRQVWLEEYEEWRNGRMLCAGGDTNSRDGLAEDTAYLASGWNARDIYHSGNTGYSWGKRLGEDYRAVGIEQSFRPGDRWSVKLSAQRVMAASLDDEGNVLPPEGLTQTILTATYDIAQDRTASARLVRQGENTNIYAAYRQRVREGTDLLVVLGDPNAEKWVSRLAVKAMWCL